MFSRRTWNDGRANGSHDAEDFTTIAEDKEFHASRTDLPAHLARSKSETSANIPLSHDPTFTRTNSTIVGTSAAALASSLITPGVDPLGLNIVCNPPDAVADVILVHGLGGSSRRTWSWQRKTDFFWPAWLQDDKTLAPLRVFTFGYNASPFGQDAFVNILDFSKDLLNRMKGFCDPNIDAQNAIGQKPIIFVAHSMGGLVVKKAFVIGKTDNHFSDMLSSVLGVMFLSTPHNGSSHAGILNTVLAATLGKSTKTYISDIANSSTFIEDLNEQFRVVCDDIQLISVYETLPTKIGGVVKKLIVGKDSGILGYPKEISTPLNADHHNVCKFSSPQDENYTLVVAMMKQLTQHLERQWSHRQSEGSMATLQKLEYVLGIIDDPREDIAPIISQGIPGSGFWLHERQAFRDWATASDSGIKIYWLSGLPGTGKTTLAGVTADHLQKRFLPQSVQHHFFVQGQPFKRSVAYCLLTIAYQIATTSDAVATSLLRLHEDTGITFENCKYRVVWDKIFEDIIFKLVDHNLYWVFDAIDECENPLSLTKLLFRTQTTRHIRVLILGRPSKELSTIAISRPDIVRHDFVTISDTLGEMITYVRNMVKESLPRDTNVQESIIFQILEKAEGSFLWAKLALRTLRVNWHTQEDIQRTLIEVPKDMESLYNNMLQHIRSQPERFGQIAMRILTWAACSFRPIRITELEAALQPEFGNFLSLPDTIVQICGHFVRLDKGTVTLIHSTARQFLLSSSDERAPVIKLSEGHEHLSSVCLKYLSDDRWRRIFAGIQNNNPRSSKFDRLTAIYSSEPFMRYAKDYWSYHLSHAKVDSKPLLECARTFFDNYALLWIQAAALSHRLKALTRAAQYIKIFLRRRRVKMSTGPLTSFNSPDQDLPENSILFLERWAIDLIRVVGKFGLDLLRSPVSIQRHIPPICPRDSIIQETYGYSDDPVLDVKGVSSGGWDDNLARLNVAQNQTVSKVVATGMYFIALISISGTMVVCLAETFEELRRIEHKEWVQRIDVNKKGNLLVSAGRFTFKVWDLATGTQRYVLEKTTHARIMNIRFGSVDSEIIVGYDDCSVVRHNLESGQETLRFHAEEQGSSSLKCPSLMVMSPDKKKIAIAYRGRPVTLWNLEEPADQHPLRCIRLQDQDRWDKEEEEVWNVPEVVQWMPDSSSLFILYQDASIVEWNFMDDLQHEHDNTEAREMVINPDGTFLLTSDRDGSLSVWTIPKLNLLYRLHYEEFVRDLAFSPDGQRIYDTRGSRCNVWEPDVLVRPEDLEREEVSSSCDGTTASEPVIAQDNTQRSQITSLACEGSDEFYCCGKDDGSVSLHRMDTSKRVKKIHSHADSVAVVALGWSPSTKYLISADDSGKVVGKRLKLKDDGKWAVFPVFDFRIDETVEQILYNPEESLALISTASTAYLWSLKSKEQVCSRSMESRSGRRWANHPFTTEFLIWIDPEFVHIHTWSDLARVSSRSDSLIETTIDRDEANSPSFPPLLPAPTLRPAEDEETVQAVAQTADKKHLICEILPYTGQNRSSSTDTLRLDLISASDIEVSTIDDVRREDLVSLGGSVQRLLGCYRDKIIFIDHLNWLCSCEVSWPMEAITQHYVIPRDWLNSSALQLLTLNKYGTLLCPRNGEVALIRYKKRF